MAGGSWRFGRPSRPERTRLTAAAAPGAALQLGSAALVLGIEAWLAIRWLRSRPRGQQRPRAAATAANTTTHPNDEPVWTLEPRSVDDILRATTGDSSQGPCAPIVVYTTSISGVRKTFSQCKSLCSIFRNLGCELDERDVAMSDALRHELKRRLRGATAPVPRVFIGDDYLGGYDEVVELNETGELLRLLKEAGLKGKAPGAATAVCAACGNFRFVPCRHCHGSGRTHSHADAPLDKCAFCNENGLTRCSSCAT